MKKAIKWVPIVGWAWQFAEVVFLERNWEKDKKAMDHQVDNLTTYPDPVWVRFILFPDLRKYGISLDNQIGFFMIILFFTSCYYLLRGPDIPQPNTLLLSSLLGSPVFHHCSIYSYREPKDSWLLLNSYAENSLLYTRAL